MDIGIAATCAEGVGVLDKLVALTVEYMNTRKQFGVTLATFQALRHRMADVKMQLELGRSMSYFASLKLNEPAAARRRALSQAKEQLGNSMRFVGQQCAQLHGGIGVTDEYIGSHYFKRLTMLEVTFGDTLHHLGEVSARMTDSTRRVRVAVVMQVESANRLRHRAGSTDGHYESYFIRANHATRALAFWIRYTIFNPAGHPEHAQGELWAIVFDGERNRHAAVKQAWPLGLVPFRRRHAGDRAARRATGQRPCPRIVSRAGPPPGVGSSIRGRAVDAAAVARALVRRRVSQGEESGQPAAGPL